jgi:pheromone shutdown protein TraB
MSEVNLGRLTIIGTMHVDKSSVERVRKAVLERKPEVVAVELCENRFRALSRGTGGPPTIFHQDLLAWLLSLLEKTFGAKTGVFPGFEMLEAAREAEGIGAKVELIDMPIEWIVQKIQSIPLGEKVRLIYDSVIAILSLIFQRRAGERLSVNLKELMEEFRQKYPALHKYLVEERDKYMGERLKSILNETTGTVLAVVGLGHVEGLTNELVKPPSEAYSAFSFTYSWA